MGGQQGEGLLALVVDDQAICRDLLRVRLQGMGLGVIEAADGAEAIDLCLRLQPDVIFMDFDMPVLDGRSAVSTLRQRGVDCIIAGFSADLSGNRRLSGLRSGMDFVFAKHPTRTDLLAAIDRAGGTGNAPEEGTLFCSAN